MVAIEAEARTTPTTSAWPGAMRPEGMGRSRVRPMLRSMSRSYHMLMAPDAPAAKAMQATATAPVQGAMAPGASSKPTRPTKTTSDITLGFRMMA